MKKLLSLVLSLLLCSCATMQYGNLIDVSRSNDSYLAQDSAKQIRNVTVPARTSFFIYEKVNDPFGVKLIEHLRRKGYGIVEEVHPKQKANFHYVVDRLQGHEVIRVSLFIGSQQLSRAYVQKHNKLYPIGTWSHKE